ncbi:TatD family hydrolase [Phocaeicola coprophilus]|jgi:TatD DNase family protein|uniref:TatD family hydrolase n=1 Tax=Phocaeicola coprophilus TaxID=387090 RepID=UPI003993626B
MLLDIHSHQLTDHPEHVLLNCGMQDCHTPEFQQARYLSVSLHPWYLTEENLPGQLEWMAEMLAADSRVIALGEAGLDKCCPVSYELQRTAFLETVRLSEQYQLPLILHIVKTSNEIIVLRHETSASQPWIIHGFRGKKELAASYLRHGFYLSFGEKYQPQALVSTPSDRLLLETDTAPVSILQLAEKAASLRGISGRELLHEITENTNRLFFSR